MGQFYRESVSGFELEPLDENIVTIDNVLASSAHTLSLNAKRLLMLAYAKQDPRREKPAGKQLHALITAREWFTLYGSGRRKPYDELREATEELQRSVVTLHPCTEYYECWNFTSRARYTHADNLDSAYVEVFFTAEVSALLADIFDCFTTYDLRDIAELSSAYAVRMYEQLARFRQKDTMDGWFKIEISKLKVMFGAEGKYKRTNDFVKRCIVEPLKQISEKADLKIDYKLDKKGNSYHMLTVNFRPKPQHSLDLKPPSPKPKPKPKVTTKPQADKPLTAKQKAAMLSDPNHDF